METTVGAVPVEPTRLVSAPVTREPWKGPRVEIPPAALAPVTDEREPVDLDRLQELVVALGGFAFYLLGAIGGAWALGAAFGPWVGFLLLIFVGLVPSIYSLKKTAERRARQQEREHFAAQQERTEPGAAGFDVPRY